MAVDNLFTRQELYDVIYERMPVLSLFEEVFQWS